jgi:hypothetical protein
MPVGPMRLPSGLLDVLRTTGGLGGVLGISVIALLLVCSWSQMSAGNAAGSLLIATPRLRLPAVERRASEVK